jgi:plasmid stabilization system protein ParE
MDYQVVLSGSSRKDLQDIVRYISFDDPSRALRFGRFLIQHTKGLAQFPERGRIVPEFGDDAIREIIVRNYRIVYRLNHDKRLIEVIRFWHAGRGTPEIG